MQSISEYWVQAKQAGKSIAAYSAPQPHTYVRLQYDTEKKIILSPQASPSKFSKFFAEKTLS